MKKCNRCGAEFIPDNPHQMYCSEECLIISKRERDRIASAKRYARNKQRQEEDARRKPKTPLYELQRLADVARMSYGQYMSMLRLKKIRGKL